MIVFLIIALGIAVFYFYVYRFWDIKKKLICMAILVYLTAGMTILLFSAAVTTVCDVVEEQRADMEKMRLSEVEDYAMRGDYIWMTSLLLDNQNYEEAFEPYWERVLIYQSSNHYLVFQAADANGESDVYKEKAQEYRRLLSEKADDVAYEENAAYAAAFLKKAGFYTEE